MLSIGYCDPDWQVPNHSLILIGKSQITLLYQIDFVQLMIVVFSFSFPVPKLLLMYFNSLNIIVAKNFQYRSYDPETWH